MECWACDVAILLEDEVTPLPIVGALVHRACYERETGQPAVWSQPLLCFLGRSDAA